MDRISKSYRYEIDIIGTDPFSLGELWVICKFHFNNLCAESQNQTCTNSKTLRN